MALKVKTGTYTGNGSTGGQAITGIGFQPKFLIIGNARTSSNSFGTVWKSEDHATGASGAAASFGENGLTTVGLIRSLDADGFTVGGTGTSGTHSTNINGETYYYIAVSGDDADIFCGTYVGNGSSRSITGVGFQPEFVVLQGGNQHSWARSASSGGDFNFTEGVAQNAGNITSLDADGFSLGGTSPVNGSGVTHYYVAIKSAAGRFDTGSYSGDGSDNRNITGVGFDPTMVLARNNSTTQALWKTTSVAGDNAIQTRSNRALIGNEIQAFVTDGFQVGSGTTVNSGTCHYLAFKDGSGGVVYEQSCVDAITLVDTVSKRPSRILRDAVSIVASFYSKATKYLLEVITPVDTVTTLKVQSTVLTEAIALVDTLYKQTSRLLSDAVSLVASFAQQWVLFRVYTESVTPADTLSKTPGKAFQEGVAVEDTLSRKPGKGLVDPVTLVDTFSRSVNRLFTDTVTLVDTVATATFKSIMASETVTLVSNFVAGFLNYVRRIPFIGGQRRSTGSHDGTRGEGGSPGTRYE